MKKEEKEKHKLISLETFINIYKPLSYIWEWHGQGTTLRCGVQVNGRMYSWVINPDMQKMFGKEHVFQRVERNEYTHRTLSWHEYEKWIWHELWFENDFITEEDFIL